MGSCCVSCNFNIKQRAQEVNMFAAIAFWLHCLEPKGEILPGA